jgi:hypothetical protein
MYFPHGVCLRGDTILIVWTASTDILIAAAYYLIPLLLWTLSRRLNVKIDPVPRAMKAMFGLFIFCCGTGHVLDAVSIWVPLYLLKAIVNTCTALTSVITGVLFLRNMELFASLITFRYLALQKLDSMGITLDHFRREHSRGII